MFIIDNENVRYRAEDTICPLSSDFSANSKALATFRRKSRV
jgi:hypothetical protein